MKLEELKCISEHVNLDQYIEMREQVKSYMKFPEWLGDLTKDDIVDYLQHGAKIWIYYTKDEPVCSMMLFPPNKEVTNDFNLYIDYHKVADYGPMFVNPKYVGHHLQYQMLLELDRFCIQKGYQYAIGTIHPQNIWSIENIQKDQFIYIGQKVFKRGLRNVYLKCFDDHYVQKILSFIIYQNKLLLLKGSDKDPQFYRSFWYVVTGSTEKEDATLIDTVKREIKEETNLDVLSSRKMLLTFEYESLGNTCVEHAFVSYVSDNHIKLNEESVDYKWCDIDEFISLIHWYGSKELLQDLLKEYIE